MKPYSAIAKKPALILTLGTALAFITGGGVAYWWLNNGQQRVLTSVDLPIGTEVLPQDALIALSLSTDAKQWQQLRSFGTAETQSLVDEKLVQWRDRLLTANGYDYDRDIQPWVGESVTIAFLPSGEDAAASAPEPEPAPETAPESAPELTPVPPTADAPLQSTVIILPIADPLQAQQTIGSSPQSQSGIERDYKGYEIREFESTDSQTYSTTVLDGKYVVIATESTAIDQVIDTYKGEASVAETPGYRQAIAQVAVEDSPFLQAYVNLLGTQAIAPEEAANLPLPTQSLGESRGVAATMTLEANGVRMQTVTWLDPDSDTRYDINNTASEMPTLLPADTLLLISGGNLREQWESYSQRQPSESSAANPIAPANLKQGLLNGVGLDVDQDLMPWMNGEFALALLPTSGANSAKGFEVLFLAQAGDRSAAEKAMSQFDEIMTSRYYYEKTTEDNAGEAVTNLTAPSRAISIKHGWLDRNIAFLALTTPNATVVLPPQSTTLTEDNLTFKTLTSQAPQSNSGHFFIDIGSLLDPENGFPLPTLPPTVSNYVTAIQAIAVTAKTQNDRNLVYDISVLLKKAGNPGRLPDPDPALNAPTAN